MTTPPAAIAHPPHLPRAVCAILPLLFLTSAAVLLHAKGPYWLGDNADPDYAYLLNALALTQGHAPAHTDHPGTPVQLLIAAVISITHLLAGQSDLVTDVLRRPELYLTVTTWTFLTAIAAALYYLGHRLATLTRSISTGLLTQSAVFLLPTALHESLCARPEPVIFAGALLLIAHLTYPAPNRPTLHALTAGLLTGLLIAAKLTALPLIALPLIILPGPRNKLLSLAATPVAFALATIPIWPTVAAHVAFATRLATHTDRYGSGPAGADWLRNLHRLLALLADQPLFDLAIAATLIAIALDLVNNRRPSITDPDSNIHPPLAPTLPRLTLALLAAQLLTLLMLYKHPFEDRYAIAGLATTGPALALSLHLLIRPRAPSPSLLQTRFATAAFILCLAAAPFAIAHTRGVLRTTRDTEFATVDFLRAAPPTAVVIPGYGAPSPIYALYFGNTWSAHRFDARLIAVYSDQYVWDTWQSRLTDFTGRPVPWPATRRPLYLIADPFTQKLTRLPKGFRATIAAKHPPLLVYQIQPPAAPTSVARPVTP